MVMTAAHVSTATAEAMSATSKGVAATAAAEAMPTTAEGVASSKRSATDVGCMAGKGGTAEATTTTEGGATHMAEVTIAK